MKIKNVKLLKGKYIKGVWAIHFEQAHVSRVPRQRLKLVQELTKTFYVQGYYPIFLYLLGGKHD